MKKSRRNEFQCPACGSQKASLSERTVGVQAPYGPEVEIQEKTYTCLDCGEEFDYSKSYDNTHRDALETSKKASVSAILDHLSVEFSFSAVERALDLPQRTLSRWKSTGDTSAIGVALLRIIRTYPWILRVAEAKFEPAVACDTFVQTAVNTLLPMARQSSPRTWFDSITLPQTNFIQFVISNPVGPGPQGESFESCTRIISSPAVHDLSQGVWK